MPTHTRLTRRAFNRQLGCALCAGILGPTARAAAQQPEVPASVRKLYDASLVIDCLSTPNTFNVDYPPAGKKLTPEQLDNARRSGITAVNMTVHGNDIADKLQTIADIKADIASHPERLLLVKNAADLTRAKKTGVMGIILGFQGLEFLQTDLTAIDRFADESVLIMQLTYNADSTIGSGCMVNTDNPGLKDNGREAVRRINARHVVVDLAHSHPQTALAAARASITPIIVSHSACREIYPHPRNQPDEVLRTVAQGGGTFGVYTMPYLGQDPVVATRALFNRHLFHALKVCGEDHVGIGSDNSTTPIDYNDAYKAALKTPAASPPPSTA
jgi:membrane dipeptidase